MQRTILNLQPGESAYTPTHAAWIRGSDMMLNGHFPIKRVGGGSFGLRLVKLPNGNLAVDLSGCQGERFSTIPAFAGDVPAVRVDVALTQPLPDPDRRRIFDMTGDSFGFVSTESAWVFGAHMWLDGLATVCDKQSGETPLLVERYSDGSFVIDNHFCQDAQYQTAWRDECSWPVQVLQAVRSRRLH